MVRTLLVFVIILTGAVPYGGVALWAQTLIGVLCMILAILMLRCEQRHALSSPPLEGLCLFYALAGWIALIATVRAGSSLFHHSTGALPVLSTTLFLWCAWCCLVASTRRLSGSSTALRLLITGVVSLATVEALLGIIGLYTSLGIYSKFVSGLRAAGTFPSGNSMGGFLALSLPPTLAMAQASFAHAFQHVRIRKKNILHNAVKEDYCLLTALLWLLAALIQSIALLLSGSRGAISAAFVAIVCLTLWYLRTRDSQQRKNRIPIIAGILIALLVFALGVGGTYAIAINRLKQLESVQQAALPRTQTWTGVIKMIATHPLGVGPGGFSEAFTRFQPGGYGGFRVYYAHNDYLEFAAETGIPGLLLLIAALGALLTAALRHLRAPQDGQTIWIRRAALLSVIAGLIHALVDFNLLSRPGVAALFFCLLGVALSRHHQPQRQSAENRQRLGLPRMITPLICGLLTANQLRIATASVLMEQGAGAIIGEASNYFWLPIPSLSPEQALHRLSTAHHLVPESAEIDRRTARALVTVSDLRTHNTIMKVQAENPDVPPENIAARMRVLLRMDEHTMLTLANECIQRSLSHSPANADAAALAALISARLAGLNHAPDQIVTSIEYTLDQAARARELAPNDATVHRLLMKALAILSVPLTEQSSPLLYARAQSMIIDIGRHLLQIGDSQLVLIIDDWARLQVDPFDAIDAAGTLPVDAAWHLYQFYNKKKDINGARRALDALEQGIHSQTLSSAGFRDATQSAEIITRYRPLLIRERACWALRERRFDDYRANSDDYQTALNLDLSLELAKTKSQAVAAPRFHYLKLINLYETRGLDLAHATELAELSKQHGESDIFVAGILMPFCPEPLPEPTGASASSENTPDNQLNMQLLGGRIVLVGFSIRNDAVRIFWRFTSRVPSDLQVVCAYKDHTDAPVTSASLRFTQALGREFGMGAPAVDKVFRTDIPIPATAALSDNLIIGLRRLSTSQWLPAAEGLPYAEIYRWKELLRQEPALPSENSD